MFGVGTQHLKLLSVCLWYVLHHKDQTESLKCLVWDFGGVLHKNRSQGQIPPPVFGNWPETLAYHPLNPTNIQEEQTQKIT